MTTWTAPDVASLRGDNSRPLQKIFGSLTEYLKDSVGGTTEVSQTYVRNGETTALTVGTVVYLHGQQGDRATVKRAFNTSDATSAKTLGIVAELIAPNADGLVTTLGYVQKVNTSAFTAGQTVYLSATAGQFTATKPVAPNHMVYVGVVVRANAGNGIIYVRCQNGYELDEIHDVLITSPTAGQTLSYDAVNSLWKNATFSDGGGLTNLNASNLASGTVPTGRVTGAYTGITGLGTLTSLTIGGAGANRSITINAPTGYYAIQYFQIGGVFKWHYEVNPAGDRWSLVQTGVAERIGVDSARLAFYGAGSPSIQMGDWSADNSYSAIQTSRGYLLLGRASADDGIFLRSTGAGPVHIGQGGNNTMIVGATDVTIAGSLRLSASNEAYVSYANTPDTAMPWMQGPTFQGRTGWAFYQQVTGSYRMGFRSGSSGSTRYMWCADNTLLGSAPNDAAVTRTLNVIGSGRFTGMLNPDGGISGNVNYGSFGSLSIYGENGGWYGIAFPDSASHWMSTQNGQYFGVYRNNSTWNFYVINGTFVPSDERYKRDIEPLQHGMNLIREIVTVTFDPLTEDPADDPEQTVGRTHYGFTTQNILQALANVGETRDVALVDIGGPANETNESDRQYLNHSGLIAPMVKAIQELDLRLQQLETV